jgi:hypothetical protein
MYISAKVTIYFKNKEKNQEGSTNISIYVAF